MTQPVTTTRHLRARNCRSILEKIHSAGPISAARLADQCGLRPSTISNILKDLRKQGSIEYCGFGSSTQHGGKRPLLIRLSSAHGLLCGIEVSNGLARVVLRDFALGEVHRRAFAFTPNDVEKVVGDIVRDVEAVVGDRPLLGVGLGRSAPRDLAAPEALMSTLAASIERRFTCPVRSEDHAGLAACGEWVMQEQRATPNLVFIDVVRPEAPDARVDIGLILDGRPYHGCGSAGHLRPSAGGRIDRILDTVAELLDPSVIVVRGATPSRREGVGPPVKSARFGEYAVAEGGVAHAFDFVLDGLH